jgi:hypothetical protein
MNNLNQITQNNIITLLDNNENNISNATLENKIFDKKTLGEDENNIKEETKEIITVRINNNLEEKKSNQDENSKSNYQKASSASK